MITLHPPFLSALVTGGGAAAIGCWSLIRPSLLAALACRLGGGAWKRERRKVLSIRLEGASLSFSHSLSTRNRRTDNTGLAGSAFRLRLTWEENPLSPSESLPPRRRRRNRRERSPPTNGGSGRGGPLARETWLCARSSVAMALAVGGAATAAAAGIRVTSLGKSRRGRTSAFLASFHCPFLPIAAAGSSYLLRIKGLRL